MTTRTKVHESERGIAIIAALMITMLMTALLVGFTAAVMGDQRYKIIDRNRTQAFYGAAAGVEKLTSDLGTAFLDNVAPTNAQLTALTATNRVPAIDEISFGSAVVAGPMPTSSISGCASPNHIERVGANGYSIQYCADTGNNPTTAIVAPIRTGPYEGLIAQQTPYQIDVTARAATGGEVHLVRTVESVAIPVFQFGVFSEIDLAFFAGPDFNFGGRVHTNGNLFLAQGTGTTLTLGDKVTAVGEVIRQQLQNGNPTLPPGGHDGTVNMAVGPGVYRALDPSEGSVVDGPTSTENEPLWHNVSLSQYNLWIRNGRTGAKRLELPMITVGGSNADLIRRPRPNEHTTNPGMYRERLYSKASLRILLSDTAADITTLPGVTPTAPVHLEGNWLTTPPNNGTAYGPVNATHPPVARSPGLTTAVITSGSAAGNAETLGVAAGVPGYFQVPDMLTVIDGGTTWTLTGCSATKTQTDFTCTAVTPPHMGVTTAAGATLRGTVSTIDGNIIKSTQLSAAWVSTALTLSVTSTMAFAPESFWVDSQLVSCTGYGPTQFTGCNLGAAVADNSVLSTNAVSNAGTGTIGGYLKIERGNADGSYTDVTMEILNHGIGGPNLAGTGCGDPTPNAILRLERLRDHALATCPYAAGVSHASTDYWPNVLFDPREGLLRDVNPGADVLLGGVMHYVSIDVANLARWFAGTAPFAGGTGHQARIDNTGYTVYFSDRRNNRDTSGAETGDYGFEDFVNESSADGAPNGALDTGEDINGDGVLQTYGGMPNYNGTYAAVPPGAVAPLDAAARPTTVINRGTAQVNRAILFRRALKLTSGADIAGNGVNGLTVVSENPVYVQGDYNANGGFVGPHAAAAIIADAVTLLSNAWVDTVSFTSPYQPGNRNRVTPVWYRVGIISGKGLAFPQIAGTANDFGTDGGVHNYLRYIENGDQPLNYRGSMATFFYNRQALGTFKCCTTVYIPPLRNYAFDTDFLTPSLLPPNTPMFRDLNTVGFAQEIRPGR